MVLFRRGFNLIELMIVIAIVALLATLAVPSFMKFLAKAKRSEAHVQLRSLYLAQKAYWAENGTYTATLTGPQSMNWRPEGAVIYTYGFPGSEGKNYIQGSAPAAVSDLSGGTVSAQAFVAVATADIAGNGVPDILTIDQTGKITIVQDSLA